ncbi:MAG: glycosyltransferase family 2 protein [Candidatus Omnitrophica bacterium]|nr:glycosyltransferase family 2 protein [Candidatus Omnitrophota bacterium]
MISVQMPVTRSRFLFPAIKSVIDQTSNNWELVILLDGPTPVEKQRIEEIISRFKGQGKIRRYSQKKCGIGVTRQRLFKLTRLKYILPLDDDDMLMPGCVEEFTDFIEKNKNFAIARGCSYEIEENIVSWKQLSPHILGGKFSVPLRLKKFGLPLNPGNVSQPYLLNRGYLEKIGWLRFRKRFGYIEDVDLFIRMEEVGRIKTINKLLYLKRNHQNSLLAGMNEEERLALLVYYVNKTIKRRKIQAKISKIYKKWAMDSTGCRRYQYFFDYAKNKN